jgi:gamma-butyrobetaine dioxygenase
MARMIIDEIFALFRTRGEAAYGGEAVSQTQHALQSAQLAERAGASAALIGAALLHDVGHLLGPGDEGLAEAGVDARHEEAGARWLARWFVRDLTEPVRMHVAAKRYLCATKPDYLGRLSPASMRSLELQGGPMRAEQARDFEATPHCRDALRLRSWDEAAKVAGACTADFKHYQAALAASLRR